MDVLHIFNFASLILMIISFVFTLFNIYSKILLRKYKGLMVEKIITFIEKNHSKEFIIKTLTEDGYPEDVIINKYDEIQELMNLKLQN